MDEIKQIQNHNDEIEIDLRELWQELKKNFKLIIGVTTAFVVAAAVYSFMIAKPVYQYSALIRIPANVGNNSMLVGTCQEVLKNDGVASVSLIKNTHIIKLNFMAGSPESANLIGEKYLPVAADKVNKIVDEFNSVRIESDIVKTLNIGAFEAINKQNKKFEAEVIKQEKVSNVPVSPNKKKNIVLAFVAGLFLSCGFVVTRYIFNKEA